MCFWPYKNEQRWMPAFAGMTIFSSLEGLPRGFSEFWQILSDRRYSQSCFSHSLRKTPCSTIAAISRELAALGLKSWPHAA